MQSRFCGRKVVVEAEYPIELRDPETLAHLPLCAGDSEISGCRHYQVQAGDAAADARTVNVGQLAKIKNKAAYPVIDQFADQRFQFGAFRAE